LLPSAPRGSLVDLVTIGILSFGLLFVLIALHIPIGVAMGFAGSDAGTIRIEGMGYFDPDIITFYGQDQMGMRTQLVQHVSQLSVMLRALPKQTEEAPPRRIGFRLAQDLGTE